MIPLTVFSTLAGADFKIWKISKSRQKVIIKLSKHEFLNKGDRLYLQNDEGKCWVDVVKVRRPFALASSVQCRFKFHKENRLVHSNHFWQNGGAEPSPSAAISLEESEDLASHEVKKRRKKKKLPPPPPHRWQRKLDKRGSYGGGLRLSFLHSMASEINITRKGEDEEKPEINGAMTTAQELQVEYFLSGVGNNKMGLGFGFSRHLERKISGLLKSPPLSFSMFYGNIAYFFNKRFYFYGGFNYSLPSIEEYQPDAETEFEDFTPVGGVGYQLGVAFYLGWKTTLLVEYKKISFFSQQTECLVNSSDCVDDGESTVGTYGIEGLGVGLTFSLF